MIVVVIMVFFASLNVRGLTKTSKQTTLIHDLDSYNISIAAIQETKIQSEDEIGTLQLRGENRTYEVYYVSTHDTNKHHGVGIVVDSSIKSQFKKIRRVGMGGPIIRYSIKFRPLFGIQ